MPKLPEIELIVIEDSMEGVALRSVLEWWGIEVRIHFIAKPQDVIDVFKDVTMIGKFVVFVSHGSKEGFTLPRLAKEVLETQSFADVLGSSEITDFVNLKDQIVISLACGTAHETIVDAFMNSGASFYMAPKDYPEGDATLYFAINFFYWSMVKGLNTSEAFNKAKSIDKEMDMFKLFSK